jgi:hypothetical protein
MDAFFFLSGLDDLTLAVRARPPKFANCGFYVFGCKNPFIPAQAGIQGDTL